LARISGGDNPRKKVQIAVRLSKAGSNGGRDINIAFSEPSAGWLPLRIKTNDVELSLAISYTPNDFVQELVAALSLALQGGVGRAVASTEPEVWEFVFTPTNKWIAFDIIEFRRWNRKRTEGRKWLFMHGTPVDVVTPFWKALRALEGKSGPDCYRAAMGRNFPTESLQSLSQLLGKGRSRPEPL
jgi:hypothetical protein